MSARVVKDQVKVRKGRCMGTGMGWEWVRGERCMHVVPVDVFVGESEPTKLDQHVSRGRSVGWYWSSPNR